MRGHLVALMPHDDGDALRLQVEGRGDGVPQQRAAAEGMQDVWIAFDSQLSSAPAPLHGLWLANDDPQAPVLLKKVPIDTSKDLVPVAAVSPGTGAFVIKKDLPANTYPEFIEYAHRNPVSIGNYGAGSGWQLILLELIKQTSAKIEIITGTLGKAFGGAIGGFTTGKKEIIEMLRQRSRP